MINRTLMLTLAIAVSGCTPFKSNVHSMDFPSSFFGSGGSDLNPASDKLDTSCANNSAYDACIYQKNPVAQNGGSVISSDLAGLQIYGVKIHGLNQSETLQNQYLNITTANGPRTYLSQYTQWKSPHQINGLTEQLMAYYWANHTLEYLFGRIGPSALPQTPITIITDDVFTGISAEQHTISLKTSTLNHAVQADLIIQLLGQILAFEKSKHNIFSFQNKINHSNSTLNPKGSCSSLVGCGNALASSVGDYLVGMMFPNNAKIGESLSQTTSGQLLCTQNRDLTTLSSLTRTQAFAKCADVHFLGAWYASVWWKLRTQASVSDASAAQDLDQLFFSLITNWTADSTFDSAVSDARTQSATYKNGKYQTLMNTVFTQSGL